MLHISSKECNIMKKPPAKYRSKASVKVSTMLFPFQVEMKLPLSSLMGPLTGNFSSFPRMKDLMWVCCASLLVFAEDDDQISHSAIMVHATDRGWTTPATEPLFWTYFDVFLVQHTGFK